METTDDVITSFLNGNPRASQWRSMREALELRLIDAQRTLYDLDKSTVIYKTTKRKISNLQSQVNALIQEEAIAEFVEDSVIATVARPHPLEVSTTDDF